MNKTKYAKKIFLCIILTICAWYGPAQSQPPLDVQSVAQEVGRENPFAKIPRVVKPVTPIALQSSQPIEEAPDLFVQTVMLKFLDAKSLMQAIDNMSSRYGTMAINEKNNSLIVCDTKEQLEKILSEIKKADKTPQQIMVEVVIVDVQLSDDTEMGVNWDILSDEIYDIGYRQNFTTRLGSTIENSANIGNATAFNTTGLGGDFSVISGNIRNVVSLLQEKKDVEILASPRVMVLSGKTASIEAVRELPYNEITDTSAGGSMSSTEFKKVGVTLNVTATLTDDNLIFLNVSSEQNVVVGQSVTEVPIIDTRNARSEVLLQDGQVVIIGGLRRKELTKQISQIPILGDIPLIGFIFKYTNTVVTNTELIMFLSPHIYTDEEPIPADAMEKFREIKDRPMPSLEKAGDDKK
jgi:type II secretory pathway component GspD/PulD (secretin)